MPNIIMNNSGSKPSSLLVGLKGLENYVEQETFVYILRSLYRIVFKSNELNESKHQLQRRFRLFEEQSNLPRFLSAVPVDKLLIQLEDAQYFYPVQRKRSANYIG